MACALEIASALALMWMASHRGKDSMSPVVAVGSVDALNTRRLRTRGLHSGPQGKGSRSQRRNVWPTSRQLECARGPIALFVHVGNTSISNLVGRKRESARRVQQSSRVAQILKARIGGAFVSSCCLEFARKNRYTARPVPSRPRATSSNCAPPPAHVVLLL